MNVESPSGDSSELFEGLATTYSEIQDLLKGWTSLIFEDEGTKYYIYTKSDFTVEGYTFEPVICISADGPKSPRIVIGMGKEPGGAADRLFVGSSLPIGDGRGYFVPNMIEVSDETQLRLLGRKLDFFEQKILELNKVRAEEVAEKRTEQVKSILGDLPGE